jgi:hypothetical protein
MFVLPVRHEATRLRVDFIFSSTPYERQAIARAEQVPSGRERAVRICRGPDAA